MKTRSFKGINLILSVLLVAAAVAGCSNDNGNSKESPSAVSEQPASEAASSASAESSEEAPARDTSPVTLTAIMHPQLAANKWGEDDVSKELEAKTGVKLDVTFQATWDDKQLSTMLASGAELPDFIIIDTQGSQAMANTLISQGYVQPLNELAEKYAPEFLQLMPKDMDKINQAADGKVYGVGDLYGDYSRTGDLDVSSYVDSGIAIQKSLLGTNSIETLDDFKNAIVQVKEANPNVKIPVMMETSDPTNYRSIVQILNKIYGGQPVISVGQDDSVHLNFRDPSYVSALKYLNDLYRAKLLPAENFTMNDDQRKQALEAKDVFAYFGFYYNLGTKVSQGFAADTPYRAIDLPTAPDVTRDQIKLFDGYAGLGGWHTVFISKDSKHPDRAIQYLSYLLSDEGQLLQRLGVKGKGYEDDGNGGFKFSQLRKDLSKNDPGKLATELGIDNWNWTWLEQFHTVMIGEALNGLENPALLEYYQLAGKYANNERLNLLTAKIQDNDMIVLRAKIDDLWKNTFTKMVLAGSEAKLLEEYDSFVGQAEKLGLSKLEAAYTDNYKKWKGILGNS